MKGINETLAEIKAANILYRTNVADYDKLPGFVLLNGNAYSCCFEVDIKTLTRPASSRVEMLCSWLAYNPTLFSEEFCILRGKLICAKLKAGLVMLNENLDVIKAELKRIKSLYVSRQGAPAKNVFADGVFMYGGKMYTETPITEQDFITAIKLFCGLHPFTHFLYSRMNKSYMSNCIDFEPVRTVLGFIDFPITSVANLITSLGLKYIDSSVLMDKKVVVGMSEKLGILWYGASLDKYKIGDLDALANILNLNLVEEELDAITCRELGIFASGNGE